jgi:hypothetical protein
MDTCIAMPLSSKTLYNAYHRDYYNNKVDKTIRKEQFRANYQKNKEAISLYRKEQRKLKKLEKSITIAV